MTEPPASCPLLALLSPRQPEPPQGDDASGAPADGPDRRLLYSMEEAAGQLSVSERRLRQLITSGDLPSVLLGRRRLVAHADLVAFVERLRAASAAG